MSHADLAALDPGADAVTVGFDFVQPSIALRRALDQGGELGVAEVWEQLEPSWHLG
jgi:hypothetical protein